METNYWLNRWESNQIPFHRSEANTALVTHLDALRLTEGDRVFVPLCGKTLDIGWLLAKGFAVVGAELSGLAVEQLFEELGVTPTITDIGSHKGPLKHYSATGIDIFVGDIFDLTQQTLGPVDAIYDRAAMIALRGDVRCRYAAHMVEITGTAPQLLLALDYDQSKMEGPPFAVTETEVKELYAKTYDVTSLSNEEIPGGVKGITPGSEAIWLLRSA